MPSAAYCCGGGRYCQGPRAHLALVEVGRAFMLRRGGGWEAAHHVLQQYSLAQDGSVVDAAAAVAVAARAHLEVERAVDLVLLGAKDLRKVLRHG